MYANASVCSCLGKRPSFTLEINEGIEGRGDKGKGGLWNCRICLKGYGPFRRGGSLD